MFRKEYKQANDNIKVDEELLEKTLDKAFNQKPIKRIYAYRPMTSVAAAVVLVIGCSIAYPRLMDKPVIETGEPVITIAPVGDEFIGVPDVTVQPEQKKTEAPRVATKPVKKPTVTKEPVQVVVPIETAEETMPVADTPSVARFIAEPLADESIEEQLNVPEEYTLKSSENDIYVFENSEGKCFSVKVTDVGELSENTDDNSVVWSENETGVSLKFNKDNKDYTVETETVSKEELTHIFKEFITEN